MTASSHRWDESKIIVSIGALSQSSEISAAKSAREAYCKHRRSPRRTPTGASSIITVEPDPSLDNALVVVILDMATASEPLCLFPMATPPLPLSGLGVSHAVTFDSPR